MIQLSTRVVVVPDHLSRATIMLTSTFHVECSLDSRDLAISRLIRNYISVQLPEPLRDALESLIRRARGLCPGHELYSLLTNPQASDGVQGKSQSLHISLTHPLALRRSQIGTFRDDLSVRLATSGIQPFTSSLAPGVRVYFNGRRYGGQGIGGRAFLALRLGAGSVEVNFTPRSSNLVAG